GPVDHDERAAHDGDALAAGELDHAEMLLARHLDVMPVRRHPDGVGLLALHDEASARRLEFPVYAAVRAFLDQLLPRARGDASREHRAVALAIPEPFLPDAHDDVGVVTRRRGRSGGGRLIERVARRPDAAL